MHILNILALIFSLSINPPLPKEVILIKATTQNWIVGGPNAGKGVNYRIALCVKKNSNRLRFQKLWINKREVDFTVVKKEDTASKPRYRRNDTIYIVAGYFEKTAISKTSDSSSLKPIGYPNKMPSGEAILEFKVGKRKFRYLAIEKFDSLHDMLLP